MNVSLMINAENSVDDELADINMSMRINAIDRSNTADIVRALVQKVLATDDIMKTFNLRACDRRHIQERMSQSRDFDVMIKVNKDNMPNRRAVMGPRPCGKSLDTSIQLHICAQFKD